MKKLNIPTLSSGFHDKDVVLLHASFTLLVDFFEKERAETDWTYSEDIQKKKAVLAHYKLKSLYNWWKYCHNDENGLRGIEKYEMETKKLQELISLREYLWT